MPGNVLNALKVFTQSVFAVTFRERDYCTPMFRGEETDTETGDTWHQVIELLGVRAVTPTRQPGSESMLLPNHCALTVQDH